MTTASPSVQYLVLMRGTIDDFPLAIATDLNVAIALANSATDADFRRLASIDTIPYDHDDKFADTDLGTPVGVTVVQFLNGLATAYVYHRDYE